MTTALPAAGAGLPSATLTEATTPLSVALIVLAAPSTTFWVTSARLKTLPWPFCSSYTAIEKVSVPTGASIANVDLGALPYCGTPPLTANEMLRAVAGM